MSELELSRIADALKAVNNGLTWPFLWLYYSWFFTNGGGNYETLTLDRKYGYYNDYFNSINIFDCNEHKYQGSREPVGRVYQDRAACPAERGKRSL